MHHAVITAASAQRFTVADLINEGRTNKLSEERAEQQFMWLDRVARLQDRRCPVIGAPDMRHPLDRLLARAASNGVQVVIGGVA